MTPSGTGRWFHRVAPARCRGRAEPWCRGEGGGAKGVLCFGAGKVKPEGYQNKGLQKGAVLARGILLYELSRFGRMEKITQKPQQEDAAHGGRARCTSTGWPLPPALLDTDPGVGGTQGPYFVHTEVPPARRSWCFLLIPTPLDAPTPPAAPRVAQSKRQDLGWAGWCWAEGADGDLQPGSCSTS